MLDTFEVEMLSAVEKSIVCVTTELLQWFV